MSPHDLCDGMWRMGGIFTRGAGVLVAGVVVAGLSVPAVAAQAVTSPGTAATSGWRLTSVFGTGAANIDAASPAGIAAPGRDSAWSIWNGCTWPCDSATPPPVVRHWNGRRWAAIPARDLHGLAALAVTASSARDAWLFGSSRTPRPRTARSRARCTGTGARGPGARCRTGSSRSTGRATPISIRPISAAAARGCSAWAATSARRRRSPAATTMAAGRRCACPTCRTRPPPCR